MGFNSNSNFYSNGDSQQAITFNTGPELIVGSFTESAFNYTKLNLNYSYATFYVGLVYLSHYINYDEWAVKFNLYISL